MKKTFYKNIIIKLVGTFLAVSTLLVIMCILPETLITELTQSQFFGLTTAASYTGICMYKISNDFDNYGKF